MTQEFLPNPQYLKETVELTRLSLKPSRAKERSGFGMRDLRIAVARFLKE